MATTQNEHSGNGTLRRFSFTFPYIKEDDVKVSVRTNNANVTTLDSNTYTFPSATEIQLNAVAETDFQESTGAPKTGVTLRVFRETDIENPKAVFYPGSSIRAQDLNDNTLQALYAEQEREDRAVDRIGGGDQSIMQANLVMQQSDIVFQGQNIPPDDTNEITLTVAEPTADRTITLPNVTGTVVTTGDVDTVTGTMIGPDAINGDRIADNSVDSEHYVDGSIDLAHMSANSVDSDQYVDGSIDRVHLAPDVIDGSKLADNSVDSEHYVNGSIDREHLAADIVDGTKIDDNAIDSEHYVNGSIDREHLAADIIDGTKIDDDAIDSEHYVDGSIDNQHIANHTIQYGKLQEISTDHRLLGRDNNTNADVAEVQVATDMIADDQVTYAKMQHIATNNRVLGRTDSNDGTIVETQVVSDLIADNAVTDAKLADSTDTDADRAVGTNHIKDSAVTSAKIANGTIVNDDINASAAIAGSKISMEVGELSNVTLTNLADNQILKWDASADGGNGQWVNEADGGSGGSSSTDLTVSLSDTQVTVVSSSGSNAVISAADANDSSSEGAGIMSKDQATRVARSILDSSPQLHATLTSGTNGDIVFAPNGTGSFGVTSGSVLQAGPAGGVTNPSFIVEGTDTDGASIWVDYNGDDATDSANIVLGRSNSVNGSGDHIFGIAAVTDNDVLGKISFAGADGTDTNTVGAQIFARVDGTPASNDIPAELVFSTNGGDATPTERMAILPDGNITMGGQLTLGNAGDLVLKDNDGGGQVAIGVVTDVTENQILALSGTGPTATNRFLRASGSTTGAGTHTLEWAQVDTSKAGRIEHSNSVSGFTVADDSNAALVGPVTVTTGQTITVGNANSLLKIL